MPWALELAQLCYDMPAGTLLHLPEEGAVMEQTPTILDNMKIARYAWVIWHYKPKHELKWDEDDAAFQAWILADG
ncbi:MAG: hypothetical protein ACE5FD_03135 [Anaerolineae bacterium]